MSTVANVLFFVSSALGFLHKTYPHVLLNHTQTGTEEEEEGLKSKKNFRSQSVVTQNPEAELMLEGDDDAVSLLQEKEIDNLAGEMHAHTHTHARTHTQNFTVQLNSKLFMTLVFSTFPSKIIYLQRQVGHSEVLQLH